MRDASPSGVTGTTQMAARSGIPVRDQAEPYLAFVRDQYGHKDAAHDLHHIAWIVQRLPVVAEGVSPPPRWDKLYFLACFHGLHAQWCEDSAFRQSARSFLTSLGWRDEEIEGLVESLARHLRGPETIEEKIVHDANYLGLLGAFGIAKAFTTGGAHGQTYEETVEIFEGRWLDRVQFLTPAGQRLAVEGRAYVKAFLERLRSEW